MVRKIATGALDVEFWKGFVLAVQGCGGEPRLHEPLLALVESDFGSTEIEYAIRTERERLGCAPTVYLMSEHAMHSRFNPWQIRTFRLEFPR